MDEGDRLEKFGVAYFVMDGGYYVRGEEAADRLSEQQQVIEDMTNALQGLILCKDLFDSSDRNQADAYYILAKQDGTWGNARSALARAKEAGK